MKINPNWKSRKWFTVLISMAYGLFAHIFPDVAEKAPPEQVKGVVAIVITWIIAEGTADAVSRVKSKKNPDTFPVD